MANSTLTLTTPNAFKYLKLLGKHFGQGVPTQHDASEMTVPLPFGTCQMTANAGVLTITVSGASADLTRSEQLVASHLVRFAFRENPTLTWQRDLRDAIHSKGSTMTTQTSELSRRDLLKGVTLTVGAAALLRTGLAPTAAVAQGDLPAGTVHSFSKGGVTFHTYVSPAQAVNVTSHIVEFDDQLLVVDATMLPPTAQEVSALIQSTGKPVGMAYISHEHPDHWGGASFIEGVSFSTLPQVRDGLRGEATGGQWPEPTNVLNGADLVTGMTEMSGVPVEIRHYENAEAPHIAVAVLPDQKVAIVQDLVYNGVYFAPGVDRMNWIKILEELRDDPACDTLLVGHGLPTTRGDLDTAIAYLKVLDNVMTTSATPDDAIAALKAEFPGYGGEFLLSLISEYWQG
ncbi:DUF2218 domain-containing protein [Algirhabdus cladophorae]|uniref:DUF2218 domain-containing protein n=1 Tax=Algirhabdus cladophorae TaxID=3377108 RepID=UPI003B84844F